jgi:hypothetical protein
MSLRGGADGSVASTLFVSLALVLLLLLASLPLLADLLKFFRCALLPVRLHSYMSVEMV